jgi:hypothetical protein
MSKIPAATPSLLDALRFTDLEARTPLYKKVRAAVQAEFEELRDKLLHPSNIETTTLLRGEVRLAQRILARLDEVGPESRQSEPVGPESASPALAAERFPMDFHE